MYLVNAFITIKRAFFSRLLKEMCIQYTYIQTYVDITIDKIAYVLFIYVDLAIENLLIEIFYQYFTTQVLMHHQCYIKSEYSKDTN